MNKDNITVKGEVQRKQRLYRDLRRSDIVMQIREKMAVKQIKNIDLAHRIGVSEANVSRWLKGKQNLQLDTLYLLADAIEEPLTLQVGRADVVSAAQSDFISNGSGEWRLSDATTWGNVVDMQAYQKTRQSLGKQKPDGMDIGLGQYLDGDCDEYAEVAA